MKILDDGGYVRYDFSTTSKLLYLVKELKKKYGSLAELHERAEGPKDLECKLQEFRGIGPVTTNIFLRELRTVWGKADPRPMPFVKREARSLGIDLNEFNRKTGKFILLECALIRRSKKHKGKRK